MKKVSKGAVVAAFVVVAACVSAVYLLPSFLNPSLEGSYRAGSGQRFELRGDGTFVLTLSDGYRNGSWIEIGASHVSFKTAGSSSAGITCIYRFEGRSTLILSDCSLASTFTRT